MNSRKGDRLGARDARSVGQSVVITIVREIAVLKVERETTQHDDGCEAGTYENRTVM